MKYLYATGFNAHGQLLPREIQKNVEKEGHVEGRTNAELLDPNHTSRLRDEHGSASQKREGGIHEQHLALPDLHEFQRVLQAQDEDELDLVCGGWSDSVIRQGSRIFCQGFGAHIPKRENDFSFSGKRSLGLKLPDGHKIKTLFSDTSGVRGAIVVRDDQEIHGEFWYLDSGSWKLLEHDRIHNVAFVAINGAEEVGICTCVSTTTRTRAIKRMRVDSEHAQTSRDAAGSQTCRFMFLRYSRLQDVVDDATPLATYELPGEVRDMQAGATAFILLMSNGDVRSAGSALQPFSMGRCPSSQFPAHEPHLISFLTGVPIARIAVGGCMGAALSQDRDLYIFGGRMSGQDRIDALPSMAASEDCMVQLVDVDDQADILDVAVGHNHILVLTTAQNLWVAGSTKHGQLGLANVNDDFMPQWQRCPINVGNEGQKIVRVFASDWASWLLIHDG